MGTKKPDLVCAPPSPGTALTIGQMRAAGWHLCGVCSTCRVRVWVDLQAVIDRLGPDALFWGRAARCKVWAWGDRERCPGRVVFEARSITGGRWIKLAMSQHVRDCWRALQRGPDAPSAEDEAFDLAHPGRRQESRKPESQKG